MLLIYYEFVQPLIPEYSMIAFKKRTDISYFLILLLFVNWHDIFIAIYDTVVL